MNEVVIIKLYSIVLYVRVWDLYVDIFYEPTEYKHTYSTTLKEYYDAVVKTYSIMLSPYVHTYI